MMACPGKADQLRQKRTCTAFPAGRLPFGHPRSRGGSWHRGPTMWCVPWALSNPRGPIHGLVRCGVRTSRFETNGPRAG